MSLSRQPARISKLTHRLLLLGVLLILPGCGGQEDGLALASVKGTVSFQGKLLDHGKVVFSPQPGTLGPIASGNIQPDGSFVMKTSGRTGAAVGSHRVTVHCRRALSPEQVQNRSLERTESLIPDKYWKQKQSPLTFEVEAQKSNLYEIILE